MKKNTILMGLLSAALFTACKKELNPSDVPLSPQENQRSGMNSISPQSDSSYQHVPNELLVRFKRGTSEEAKANVLARITGRVSEKVVTGAMRKSGDEEGFYVVRTPMQALEAISRVKNLGEVEYAEPNYILTTSNTSNDPYYTNGSLWGTYGDASPLKTNQWGSQAAEAWSNGHIGSNTVYIGIIDEGAMHTHKDLDANFDTRYGWDFVNNDATTYDGTSDDHGTHVAGTIGAEGNNGEGVAGVAWHVKMVSAKFLGPRGGTTANSVKAIDHFTKLKNLYLAGDPTGVNFIATNNSWGGGGYSSEVERAIGRAGDAGILFICAAGNDGRNIDQAGSYSFPACYYNWNTIVVAAITNTGALASYSNYGQVGLNNALGTDPNHSFVDIGAPGSGIHSTIPGKNNTSSYASYNGTSMATPHVTGAVALYVAKNEGLLKPTTAAAAVDAAKQIKNFILQGVTPTVSLDKKCYTSGRLDVVKTLSYNLVFPVSATQQ